MEFEIMSLMELIVEEGVKRQISPIQKVTLVEFVEEHPQLISQKQTNQHTNGSTIKLWQEVANNLNVLPGARKDWRQWRKTWRDLTTRTKNKKSAYNKGEAEEIYDLDNKILDIIGGEIESFKNTPEVELPIIEYLVDQNEETVEVAQSQTSENAPKDLLEIKVPATVASAVGPAVTEVSKDGDSDIKRVPKHKGKIKTRFTRRVPPSTNVMVNSPRLFTQTAANKAATDLVKAIEQRNAIKEKFYAEKLEIMKESVEVQRQTVEVQKQNLLVQARIANGIEALLTKFS